MKKTFFTITLKWGLILGAGLSAIQFIRTFTDHFDFYSFGPILDLLMVVLFIGALYLGIREYRDSMEEGNIKFARAYLTGIGITLTAFVIVFVYLFFQYSYIDKQALSRINERNRVRYIEKIGNDTITKAEVALYLDSAVFYLEREKTELIKSYPECERALENFSDSLGRFYHFRLENGQRSDTSRYLLKNFDRYSHRVFMEVAESLLSGRMPETDSCALAREGLVRNTVSEIQSLNVVQNRFRSDGNKVPFYENELAAALFFSFSVLIYGLLFDLFVSLYLYRNRKEEPPEEADEENREDTPSGHAQN